MEGEEPQSAKIILIAMGDKKVASQIGKFLAAENFRVELADSFQEAQKFLDKSAPHALLTETAFEKNFVQSSFEFPVIVVDKNIDHQDCLKIVSGSIATHMLLREIRQLKSKIEKSEASFNEIVDKSVDGIVVVDADGFVRYANKVVCSLVGLDRETLEGDFFGLPIERGKQTEINIKGKDGEVIVAELRNIPVQWEGENCLLILIRDITEKNAAEEAKLRVKAAEAANQVKSQFLANMSHEIRTPLNAIQGICDLFLESPLNDDQKQYVSILEQSNNNLLVLINDILDLSKIEAGEVVLETLDFDLEVILGQVCDLMSIRTKGKKLELAFQVVHGTGINLRGDPTRLQQILINLIGNSIKFTEVGHVLIKVEEESNFHLFSVNDTGIGMPKDGLKNIFNCFKQENETITRKFGGTGLGLTICQKLVTLMGGEIWVESQKGKGSTFFFKIPSRFQEHVAEREDLPDLSGKKILLVGAMEIEREIVENILIPLEMSVEHVNSAADMILWLEGKNDFDLIIFYSRNSRYNSNEKCDYMASLKALKLETRCLLALPYDYKRVELGSLGEQGFRHYFFRPLKRRELLATVCEGLGQSTGLIRQETEAKQVVVDHRPLRILLCDDNEFNLVLITMFFKSFPYKIDCVEDGKEALELFKNNSYDLVLMDMQMPIMDGYTATQKIRKWEEKNHRPRTPILAFTASVLDTDGEKIKSAGCDDILYKPVKKADMVRTVLKYTGFTGEMTTPGAENTASMKIFTGPSIDPRRLNEMREYNQPGEADVVIKLGKVFLKSMSENISILNKAIKEKDYESILFSTHTLKSTSANIGANQLAHYFEKMEDCAKGKSDSELKTYLKSIHSEFKKVKEELKDLMLAHE